MGSRMNYYSFHIGDYAAHTRNLSLLEDLAYRRLLDAYYLAERPLNGCATDVAREIGMREQVAEVEYVLGKFFELTEAGWANKRAEKEIAHFSDKKQKASEAGKASAQRRSSIRSTSVGKTATSVEVSSTDVQLTNNQEPITNNQISVTYVTEAVASACADDMSKAELWSAGKSLLEAAGLPKNQCGSFVGKLVKDYGDSIVLDAVRSTVVTQPADPVEYLKAICQRSSGQRRPLNKLELLERTNRAIGDEWLKEQGFAA